MYQIILASGSPRRKVIFEQVGIPFTVRISNKEEIITKTDPKEIVLELADSKAKDIAKQLNGNYIIIGADTLVAQNNQVMGKPKDQEEAKRMIRMLQGNKHQVYTGVSVIIKQDRDPDKNECIKMNYESGQMETMIHFAESTEVWVNAMTEQEIVNYTATKEPYDKAGAYGIQGIFAIHINRIDGDYYNIVGFPIAKLYTELCKIGIDIYHP